MGLFKNLFKLKSINNQGYNEAKNVLSENDEKDCNGKSGVVAKRIQMVLNERYEGYTLKEGRKFSDLGLTVHPGCSRNKIDYLVVDSYGREVAMIMLLNRGMDASDWVKSLKAETKVLGIGYVHFLLHLPNKKSYIEKKLAEII